MLFNFPHICEFLKFLFVIGFPFHVIVVREHTLYGINSFKFIEAYFMTVLGRVVSYAVFQLSLSHIRMGLGLGTLPY